MRFNYDFWYQPRHNVMVSSEWAAPNTVRRGFKLDDVKAGKYGQQLHFWDWEGTQDRPEESIWASNGLIPLEVRFHHNPGKHARLRRRRPVERHVALVQGRHEWKVEKIIEVQAGKDVKGWDSPVPGADHRPGALDGRPLALLLRLAARRHPPVRRQRSRQAQARRPALAGRRARQRHESRAARSSTAARRCSSSASTANGSTSPTRSTAPGTTSSIRRSPSGARTCWQIDCDTEKGGMTLNERFLVDFGREPDGPARAHEIRFPNGDSTSDIWM